MPGGVGGQRREPLPTRLVIRSKTETESRGDDLFVAGLLKQVAPTELAFYATLPFYKQVNPTGLKIPVQYKFYLSTNRSTLWV
jgi:hypothetical protein